jgi:cytoskeletal protein CcmA (bactofilin family)
MRSTQTGPSATTASPDSTMPIVAYLGPSLTIKGEIIGDEDLRIDSEVEGSISLGGHRLTVGQSARVGAEIVAREVVVQGEVTGDISAHDRIEIKRDGSVVGDLATARIVIEDGAYFKGSVEIDRNQTQVGADLATLLSRAEDADK